MVFLRIEREESPNSGYSAREAFSGMIYLIPKSRISKRHSVKKKDSWQHEIDEELPNYAVRRRNQKILYILVNMYTLDLIHKNPSLKITRLI